MKLLLTILLILMPAIACAQTETWTLDDCINYGVLNNQSKIRQQLQNEIHRENYREAVARLAPTLSAGTNAYFNFGRGLDPDRNTYININSFSNNYSVYSSLTLFEGLSGINRIKMEKINRLAGRYELQAIEDAVAYDVMEAFFLVQYNRRLVELAAEQLTESKANVSQVERMSELGLKGFPDLAEMQAKEASDNYNLTRQQNLLKISLIKLKETMNFPVDEELLTVDHIAEIPIVKIPDTPLNIFENSLGYLPRAMAAEATYESARAAYRTARGSYSPVLTVDGGFSTNFSKYLDGSPYEDFGRQFRNKSGEYVGFTMSVPIFGGFNRRAAVNRSKINAVIARSVKEENLRALYSEIEQAVADMNGQADQYLQARKQTHALEVAHQANRRRYEEGLISAMDLHTSSNRLLEARIEEMNSQLIYLLKKRLVEYYKGEPFYNTEN